MQEEAEKYNLKNKIALVSGALLRVGMTIAIEPMVTQGKWETKVMNDKWTVVTKDGKLSSHYEDTILITENGPEVLTKVSK